MTQTGSAAAAKAEPGKAVIDLAPTSVAHAATQLDETQANASGATPAATTLGEFDLSDGIPGLVRASQATTKQKVERGAEGVMWSAMQPWKGMNILFKDVRYWYLGRGFDAVIADDGRVDFHEKEGLGLAATPVMSVAGAIPAISRPTQDATGKPQVEGNGSFGAGVGVADPGAVLARKAHKEDRNAAERRDFLEKTRGLRDYLAAQSSGRPQPRVDQRILATLEKLWRGNQTPLAQRQAETFALWDSFEDDALGERGRLLVEGFIHRLSEARGVCPFDAAALARLQVHRKDRRPFSPCDGKAKGAADKR